MENIYLIGSEDVKKAGYSMQSSAEIIQSASNSLSNSLYDHQLFMTDWLNRFENILTKFEEKK